MNKYKYDVFVSYAVADSKLANELRELLDAQGLNCFMAERDIAAGDDWLESIRSALVCSQRVVILLTPNSFSRPWVLLETGAAWALERKMFPASAFVSPADIVAPLNRQQVRPIETTEEKVRFATEVAAYKPAPSVPDVDASLITFDTNAKRCTVRIEPKNTVPFKSNWSLKCDSGAVSVMVIHPTEHYPEEARKAAFSTLHLHEFVGRRSNKLRTDDLKRVTLRFEVQQINGPFQTSLRKTMSYLN